jgi:hypothetical protein
MSIANLPSAILGLILVFLGLAMAGMRAGYWVFVVAVKSVVMLAVIVAGAIWYVSSAHVITRSYFTTLYNAAAKQATSLGVYPKHLCFPSYCANQLAFIAPTGETVFLTDAYEDNGSNVQELCLAPPETSHFRVCSASNGKRVEESWNGKAWVVTQTLADHFD